MNPKPSANAALDPDPFWYKKAVVYQAHVRSYYDVDNNGIGDFCGLTAKLDYLQDLGITAIWLLPFYPSPLKDDGYDIADYYSINPIYGTLADFKEFLREAHRRGLRVITELVVNHTSDQHAWFQRSRRAAPGTRWRDFYVWSDTPERYKDARIIFKDFEHSNWTWDPVAHAYYWHRFYAHQPDLNFDSPHVHKEILRVLDFWLDLGVDGLRLDAVPYLYEREGTNCENLPETHAYLKTLRRHVDEKYGDRMLLAEANQWPEEAVVYFGTGRGDECHMAFHFPLMPRLFMSVRMEDRVPIIDILQQTPPIPETSQWAVFLRNHDELTLEMVTDEERDYMYRVYAQDTKARINLGIRRRLAPLLGNDRKRIELLNALLLSLPGTPVIYYGDEIGMGDNIYLGDRNGVRTPMQWSSDKNAGFSRANPQGLYLPIVLDPEYHYEAVNVEARERNPHSILWFMKRLLAMRKRWQAFGQGSIEFLHPENRKILAFVRRYEKECLLIVSNLSRFVQAVELDLSAFQQFVPTEVFSRNAFPTITERPYFLTLGPHSFYWFTLEARAVEPVSVPAGVAVAPETLGFTAIDRWEEVLKDDNLRARLEGALGPYLQLRRWFGGKARDVRAVHVREQILVPMRTERAFLLLLEVDYLQGDPEHYVLPLAFARGAEAELLQRNSPHLVIAPLKLGRRNEAGLLFDAVGSKAFATALLETIARRRTLHGEHGDVAAFCPPAFRALRGDVAVPLEPSLCKAEQSNSSLLFGDRFILKLFRRFEVGPNPDLEIGRFLARHEFPNVPMLAGGLEFNRDDGQQVSLAILHALVPNAQDGWSYTQDALGRYYERMDSLQTEPQVAPRAQGSLLDWTRSELPAHVPERVGTYVELARLLGERTAALHVALASDTEDQNFRPEPFTPFYQRAFFQSLRNQAVQNLGLLRRRLKTIPESLRDEAQRLVVLEPELIRRYRTVADGRLTGARTRVHGDFHLGQVLHNGRDFLIIDFEGEPARPLTERRIKRTPLQDVAGMLRSFQYAAQALLYEQFQQGILTAEKFKRLEYWANYWSDWVSVSYLRAYINAASKAEFLPRTAGEVRVLLEANLLHKAVYELGYELNNRPAWLPIPLRGLLRLLDESK